MIELPNDKWTEFLQFHEIDTVDDSDYGTEKVVDFIEGRPFVSDYNHPFKLYLTTVKKELHSELENYHLVGGSKIGEFGVERTYFLVFDNLDQEVLFKLTYL